ncbi:hypothetical protein B0H14DRAFT_3711079 [Mycena olivaceomarginata]|nr:hypothetical protein B0H14DRAFT_3711079 [Mycena olivaceomarginata]
MSNPEAFLNVTRPETWNESWQSCRIEGLRCGSVREAWTSRNCFNCPILLSWGSSVEHPKSVGQISWNRPRNWGTSPEVIFDDAAITEELKSCNMWYLLTDGEVDWPVNFARKALENGMANTPVVFVITGTKLTSTSGAEAAIIRHCGARAVPVRLLSGDDGKLP